MSKPLYEKKFSREFMLSVGQIWYQAEAVEPCHWVEQRQPNKPHIIFVGEQGRIHTYMDQSGIDWLKSELKKVVQERPEVIEKSGQAFKDAWAELEPIYESGKNLSREELAQFFETLLKGWTWFNSVWWMMEMLHDTDHPDYSKIEQVRHETDELAPNSDKVIERSVKALYPEVAKYAHVLLIDEILSGDIPPVEELEERWQGFIYTDEKLFVGQSFKTIEEAYEIKMDRGEVDQSISEVSGQVAFQGKVSGKVRRIMSVEQVDELEEGEILLAPMTLPEYVPAMKKAAAFVTDEGGVMCHAAIMAREFKKPCIIGTKIATKVFQDGDMVEVDAEKGIVKKI